VTEHVTIAAAATDASKAETTAGVAVLERERTVARVEVPEAIRAKLVPRIPGAWWVSWLATAWVALIAGILRGFHFDVPTGIMFDETYYAKEGEDLLQHGVEWARDTNTPAFVVHPPLGKWMIAAGIKGSGWLDRKSVV